LIGSYRNYALATHGVDAIKFETHIAEAESSAYEPFRVKFNYKDDTKLLSLITIKLIYNFYYVKHLNYAKTTLKVRKYN
jgi:hypothetical protein